MVCHRCCSSTYPRASYSSALLLLHLDKIRELGNSCSTGPPNRGGSSPRRAWYRVMVEREAIVIIKLSDAGDQALVIQILSRDVSILEHSL